MGRVAESIAGTEHTKEPPVCYKLSSFSNESLIKWATAFGLKEIAKIDTSRYQLLSALDPYADGILDPFRPANMPIEPPAFTLKTIRDAIPDYCFERNLYTSLSYLFSDLSKIAFLGYLATLMSRSALPTWLLCILWPLYWYTQGCLMTGVWVIAHECGHQSFSESQLANNIIGTILHSLLLVPYHSWRISHGKHHANTGSCENDEVFCPITRSDWGDSMLRETPIANIATIVALLLVAWPVYLVLNISGPPKYRGQDACHFSPHSVLFDVTERELVFQSVASWFVAFAIFAKAVYTFGFQTVGTLYIIPYLIVNAHLIMVTFLQHTDVFIPHFRGKEWTWLRGALTTVDRSYGPVLDHLFHHITDTHVCHHLFSKIPFYHAVEATRYIRQVIGPYYLKDDTPILWALYRSHSYTQLVEDEGDIVFGKNMK